MRDALAASDAVERVVAARFNAWASHYGGALAHLIIAVDVAIIVLSREIVWWLAGAGAGDAGVGLAAIAAATFLFLGILQGLYKPWRTAPLSSEIGRALLCWFWSAAVAGSAGLVLAAEPPQASRLLLAWFALAPAGLIFARLAVRLPLRLLRAHGLDTKSAAIVGNDERARRVAREIEARPWMGIRVLGFFHDTPAPGLAGTDEELVSRGRDGEVQIVYIAVPLAAERRIERLLRELDESRVLAYYAGDAPLLDMFESDRERIGPISVIRLVTTPLHGLRHVIKRLEDVVVSSAVLAVLAVPMLVIALAIWLSGPGGIFFRQRRYGFNGEEFEIWKFRTMTVSEGDYAFEPARRDDERVFPVGRFLRRTSLDELPQLFNVLRGNMSLVGPRPHPIALDEHHRELIDRYSLRHKVKPGITGWAQVNGFRGTTSTVEEMRKRTELDLEYLRDWSLSLDLKILWLTLIRGFTGRNVY